MKNGLFRRVGRGNDHLVNPSRITYRGAPVGIGTWELVPAKFLQIHEPHSNQIPLITPKIDACPHQVLIATGAPDTSHIKSIIFQFRYYG